MTPKKSDPELTINLWWLGKIVARGREAINAVKWPIAFALCASALFPLIVLYAHSDLLALWSALSRLKFW